LLTPYFNRKLHSLLGVIPVGVFLLFHLTLNYFATRGPDTYNVATAGMEKLPFKLFIETIVIYLPILFHAIYGIYIVFQAKNNVTNFGYYRNWMFFWQRITGVIVFIFISWHVWQTRIQAALGAHVNFDMMANIVANPLYYWFYVIGIISATFHFSNGMWSFLVSWGITIGPRAQRISSYFWMIFFVLISIVGVTAITAFK